MDNTGCRKKGYIGYEYKDMKILDGKRMEISMRILGLFQISITKKK